MDTHIHIRMSLDICIYTHTHMYTYTHMTDLITCLQSSAHAVHTHTNNKKMRNISDVLLL